MSSPIIDRSVTVAQRKRPQPARAKKHCGPPDVACTLLLKSPQSLGGALPNNVLTLLYLNESPPKTQPKLTRKRKHTARQRNHTASPEVAFTFSQRDTYEHGGPNSEIVDSIETPTCPHHGCGVGCENAKTIFHTNLTMIINL